MNRTLLDRLLAEREAKRPVALLTDLTDGTQRLSTDELAAIQRDAADEALRTDRCITLEVDGTRLFVQPFNPPLRMIVVGAVHVAQSLVRFAAEAGYAVLLIDPREAFARPDRFPDVEVSHEWPDQAVQRAGVDRRTAVVTLTHDAKLDEPALRAALDGDAFYIGALGSERTHAARLERLRTAGYGDAALARIHGPVGLPIGARSPAEIAVAILAQVTAKLRGADSRPAD